MKNAVNCKERKKRAKQRVGTYSMSLVLADVTAGERTELKVCGFFL